MSTATSRYFEIRASNEKRLDREFISNESLLVHIFDYHSQVVLFNLLCLSYTHVIAYNDDGDIVSIYHNQ